MTLHSNFRQKCILFQNRRFFFDQLLLDLHFLVFGVVDVVLFDWYFLMKVYVQSLISYEPLHYLQEVIGLE